MKKANLLSKGILLSILGLGLSACDEKEIFNKNTTPTESVDVKIESLKSESVQFQLIATDEPNKYVTHISWTKNLGAIQILVNNEIIFKTSGAITSFDDYVEGGQIANYEIQQVDSANKAITQEKKKIEVPKDYIFSGKTVLSDNFSFSGGRLFLLSSALIQTQGFGFKVEVDQIISEDSSIETYPSGIKETYEKNGLSAGNINLKSRTALGSLSVSMRGTSGGDGRGSMCHSSFGLNCNASSGGRGGDGGYFSLTLVENNHFILNRKLENGIGGKAGIACAYSTGGTLEPYMIWGFDNNCSGYGKGTSNGRVGENGKGQICYKLKKEDQYECI